jgi:antitoxin ParD1/3/4
MRSTQQLNIMLPSEMASDVRAKVTSGEYASESEVIEEALKAFQLRDTAIEDWLKDEVVASYTQLKAHPETGKTLDAVRASLIGRAKTRHS